MAPIMANTRSRGGKVTNLAPTKGNPLNGELTKSGGSGRTPPIYNPGTGGGPMKGKLQPIPKGNQFPTGGTKQIPPSQKNSRMKGSLQEMAKNRLRGLNG
jgi:hypothetical protein